MYSMGNVYYTIINDRQMLFAINSPGDVRDFCMEDSAFRRGKNQRRKCHKEKFMMLPI